MRKFFTSKAKSFAQDKKGATMVEYAIVVSVIAMVAAVGAITFGSDVNTAFANMAAKLVGTPNNNTTAP